MMRLALELDSIYRKGCPKWQTNSVFATIVRP